MFPLSFKLVSLGYTSVTSGYKSFFVTTPLFLSIKTEGYAEYRLFALVRVVTCNHPVTLLNMLIILSITIKTVTKGQYVPNEDFQMKMNLPSFLFDDAKKNQWFRSNSWLITNQFRSR